MNAPHRRTLLPIAVLIALGAAGGARAQAPAAEPAPFKIGIVTFLSGAAAGPFGVPARNGAEVIVEALNAGKMPAPYATKGLGGAPIAAASSSTRRAARPSRSPSSATWSSARTSTR